MEIETLVRNYKTPEIAKRIVESTKILLLVGISGAGKDTIKRKLLQQDDYMDIVSHTTRAPRHNNNVAEIDDVDYHFIGIGQAEQMLQNQEFIEAKYVHGTIYGTSTGAIKASHDANKIAVTDLDVQGVTEYKSMSQDVMALFILPPDYDTWQSRLHARYVTSEEFTAEWPKRRQSAITELTHALEVPYYHFIINDDLQRAVRIVDEIAHRGDAFNRHDDEARLVARDLLDMITNT